MIEIAVINESTVVTDANARACAAVLQKQVTNDFAPAWDIDGAALSFFPNGSQVPAGVWQLVILDDSDQADALGYHELTADGLPIGKIFAKSDLDAGTNWTVTASHELLEMLGDPNINKVAEVDNADGTITMYAWEACDAVEADNLGYLIDGISVSDFVLQSWFVPAATTTGAGPYSFRNNVSAPLALATGGYIGVLNVAAGAGWTQITADGKPGPTALPGSRRARRRTPDREWRRSAARTSR
jgi:hypothetical protein